MADTKISDLTTLAGASIDAANDLIPIIDVSATTAGSKKIVVSSLSTALGLGTMATQAASAVTITGGSAALTGQLGVSLNGAASTPPVTLTGAWFTGGSATTTKPQLLIEPSGSNSNNWSTSGTGLGMVAPTSFLGNLLHLQVDNATSGYRNVMRVYSDGTYGYINLGMQASTLDVAIRNNYGNLAVGLGTNTGSGNSIGVYRDTYEHIFFYSAAAVALTGLKATADSLSIIRGTNAQSLKVYGTYTDASNYVRAAINTTSTTVALAAETAGTGADNINLTLTAAGTGIVNCTGTTGLGINGTKVIGAQAAAVADASGGAVVDAEARTALNDLLAKLRTHGLIAT